MKIQLLLDTGTPTELRPAGRTEKSVPIEDEIRDSLELIESGRDSAIEWRAIRGLYKQLLDMQQTPRVVNLRKMIQPVLNKYGYTE